MGVSHLQYPAMDTSLLETWIGEGGGVSQPMARREEVPTATASMRARTGGWNDGTYQLPGDHDAFSITTAPSAD
jgi:hypothetical protein